MNYDLETEEDYRNALHRFIELCEKPVEQDEIKEIFLLMKLMEKYEQHNCPFH
jgi:bacterioferritin (cytochrome b1)